MWGTEPDGTGRHGVRVAGVEAPHGVAESAGVPGVSGEATEPGRAGVARQAAGASGGQSDRGAGNGAGRAGARLVGTARDLGEIRLQRVQRLEQRRLFRELVGRYHYLGHRVPFGAHLRYLVYASEPAATVVACVQFSSAAWRIAVRDRWIGWEAETRARQLVHVVSNSRYLVLPWVQVKNLASRILSRAVRQLAVDWPRSYGVEVFWWRRWWIRGATGELLSGGELDRAGEHPGREAGGSASAERGGEAETGAGVSAGGGGGPALAGGLEVASGGSPVTTRG